MFCPSVTYKKAAFPARNYLIIWESCFPFVAIAFLFYAPNGIGVINMGTRMNGELLRFYLENSNINW